MVTLLLDQTQLEIVRIGSRHAPESSRFVRINEWNIGMKESAMERSDNGSLPSCEQDTDIWEGAAGRLDAW